MIRSFVYRLLENPLLYNLSQRILAPGHSLMLKKQFDSIFQPSGGLILDVGCGPVLNTPFPDGRLYGVDINLKYIKQYINLPKQSGVVSSADDIPFKSNMFNESRCFGLLHHLPRKKALMTVNEMVRCTKTNGRIIIIDSVCLRNPYLRPLAWANQRLDRGRWIRHDEELLSLVKQAYGGPWQRRRFTYTFVGHEAIALVCQKRQEHAN